MMTFPSAPYHVRHLPQATGLVSASSESQPSSSQPGTQLTDFSQIFQNPPRTLPVYDVIHVP